MDHSTDSLTIETRVADPDRINFLPRHFGSRTITLEQRVYVQLSQLIEDYRGRIHLVLLPIFVFYRHRVSRGGVRLYSMPASIFIQLHRNTLWAVN